MIDHQKILDKQVTEEKISCLSFFPQSHNTILVNQEIKLKMLNLLKFFLKELLETINDFYFEKEFSKFDPHVGDTLCQIRAYKVLLLTEKINNLNYLSYIIKKYTSLKSIFKNVEHQIYHFEELIRIKKSRYNKILDRSENMEDFFKEKNLIFNVGTDLFFLMQSRVLCTFSKIDYNGISKDIDYEKLCKETKNSKTLIKKLSHYYQQSIANKSCLFIFDLLDKLSHSKERKMVLHYLKIVDKDKREALPCYDVTKIIISHILQYSASVLLIVNAKYNEKTNINYFLFTPNKKRDDFQICQIFNILNFDFPCLIIKGETLFNINSLKSNKQFLERILKMGLKNVVLANMATHPQYSALKSHEININPYHLIIERSQSNTDSSKKILQEHIEAANFLQSEFIYMKEFASTNGCCNDNQTLFFITHIFCDLLSKQLNKTYSIANKVENLLNFDKFTNDKYEEIIN